MSLNHSDIQELHQQYKSAQPFEHIVLHDLFDPEKLDAVVREWPLSWDSYDSGKAYKLKKANPDPGTWGRQTQEFMGSLLNKEVVYFLRALTGFEDLLSDPSWRGGGLHDIHKGGHLGLHRDFNEYLGKQRAVNMLIYLNRDWEEEYGGHLELSDGEKIFHRILPAFNTTVVFTTMLKNSYHGHPHPLTCPEGNSRKSIAAYYYLPKDCKDPHGTLYIDHPEAKPSSLSPQQASE